jgi:hypothetical protein
MPNVEVAGRVISFPDDLDEESLNKAVATAASQLEEGPGVMDRVKDAAKAAIRPTLETAGGIAGGLVGAAAGGPAALATGVAGGALGFAGGKQLANIVEEKLGMREPPESVTEAVIGGAKDVATGAAMEMAGGVAGQGIIAGAQFVKGPFAKKVGEAGVKLAEMAAERGVNLTPAEITRSKSLALLEKILDNSMFSSEMMQNFKLGQMKALIKTRDKILAGEGAEHAAANAEVLGQRIQKLADDFMRKHAAGSTQAMTGLKDALLKKLGSTESYEELGQMGQEAIVKATQARAAESTKLYDAVKKHIPETATHEPEALRDAAMRLFKKEALLPPALQDKQLIAALEQLAPAQPKLNPRDVEFLNRPGVNPAVRAKFEADALKATAPDPKPPMTWEQLQQTRSAFKDLIRQNDPGSKAAVGGMQMTGNRASGAYKQLAKAAEQDLAAMAEASGPGAKEALDLANAFYREGKQTFNAPLIQRMARANPNTVVDMMFSPGNARMIKDVRSVVGEETFGKLKGKFTGRLLESGDPATPFDPKKLLKNMQTYGEETLHKIYSPKELDMLQGLANAGEKLEAATVQNPFFERLVKASPEKIVDFVMKPGNTENVKMLRKHLGPEAETALRQAFLGKIMGMNQHGAFSPMKFHSQLVKYGDTTLKEILPGPLFKEVKALGGVSLAANAAEQLAGNPSGTARNLISYQEGRSFLTNPLDGTMTAIPYATFARVYLDPATRKWLTSGLQVPLESKEALKIYGKLIGYLAKPFISRATEQDFSTPVYADEITRRAVTQGSSPKEIAQEHWRSGVEAWVNKDTKTAKRNWELALKIDPRNAQVRQSLERLQERERGQQPVGPKSEAAYKEGLLSSFDKDETEALQKYKLAYARDKDNTGAKRAIERIEQKRKSQTALAGR